VGGAEGEAAGGGEAPVQRLELDRRVLERRDQEQRPLLVLEEEVLGMAARNGSAQLLRLLDGKQRRMRHRRVGDAEPVEEGEEVGRSGGRGGRRPAGVWGGRGAEPPVVAAGTCEKPPRTPTPPHPRPPPSAS